MIAAVAWSFASPLFQIHLYSTTYTDDLLETPQPTLRGRSSERRVRWKIEVYFHSRRKVIAEWDVCAETPLHAGIMRVCKGTVEKRRIEEETRCKIKEERGRDRRY
jgi:hypothetical protein